MPLLAQSLSENRRTLALAAPIVAGFVGQMLMGWADTIMVGKVGVIPLAACAFANTVLAVPLVFGFAVLSSVSVRASLAFGAGRQRMSGEALRGGLLIALLLGILVGGGLHLAAPFLSLLGQGDEITNTSRNFLVLCAWSAVPVFITTAAKNFCEALSRPWVPFWIMMAGVLLNIALNWVLIYGNLGLPALGIDGAGVATATARTAVATAVVAYVLTAPSLKRGRPAGLVQARMWGRDPPTARDRTPLRGNATCRGQWLCQRIFDDGVVGSGSSRRASNRDHLRSHHLHDPAGTFASGRCAHRPSARSGRASSLSSHHFWSLGSYRVDHGNFCRFASWARER